ncbi:hypothetical protein EVAR_24665_1 [Eumeta japonica]|uniref:Uncharacterized protein n=1 Tax=Eumeta variegata TaxID=151549 RepID=A0A4C1WES6_EUMVA|nr:hypothetical protein EVAR_24665_1 [Eumeta japonica]
MMTFNRSSAKKSRLRVLRPLPVRAHESGLKNRLRTAAVSATTLFTADAALRAAAPRAVRAHVAHCDHVYLLLLRVSFESIVAHILVQPRAICIRVWRVHAESETRAGRACISDVMLRADCSCGAVGHPPTRLTSLPFM